MFPVYMGMHVTLTGVRSAFAPFLGMALYLGWDAKAYVPGNSGLGAWLFLVSALLGVFVRCPYGKDRPDRDVVVRQILDALQSGGVQFLNHRVAGLFPCVGLFKRIDSGRRCHVNVDYGLCNRGLRVMLVGCHARSLLAMAFLSAIDVHNLCGIPPRRSRRRPVILPHFLPDD